MHGGFHFRHQAALLTAVRRTVFCGHRTGQAGPGDRTGVSGRNQDQGGGIDIRIVAVGDGNATAGADSDAGHVVTGN